VPPAIMHGDAHVLDSAGEAERQACTECKCADE
jgi:hypothetical protein